MELLRGKTKCVVIFRGVVYKPDSLFAAEVNEKEKAALSNFLYEIEPQKKLERRSYSSSKNNQDVVLKKK